MSYLAQLFFFAAFAEHALEFERNIEVIFDGALAAAGDDNHRLDPCCDAFLDDVLNQRSVDHRQHLLRRRFGRGQKARAQTGGGKDCFANFSWHNRGVFHTITRRLRQMLDLNYVRENLESVRAALEKRGLPTSILDDFEQSDLIRRTAIAESDQLNAERNAASREIGALMKEGKGEEAE